MKIIRFPVCENCGEKIQFTYPRGMSSKEIEEDWDRLCEEALLMHSNSCNDNQ